MSLVPMVGNKIAESGLVDHIRTRTSLGLGTEIPREFEFRWSTRTQFAVDSPRKA